MSDPKFSQRFDTDPLRSKHFAIKDLGTVGRLFGALISKAGIPVPTEITQKVLTGAQHLGR